MIIFFSTIKIFFNIKNVESICVRIKNLLKKILLISKILYMEEFIIT